VADDRNEPYKFQDSVELAFMFVSSVLVLIEDCLENDAYEKIERKLGFNRKG